jgi:hypothetical protein
MRKSLFRAFSAVTTCKSCLEMISCQCSTGCITLRCSCEKAKLPCTNLCKCHQGKHEQTGLTTFACFHTLAWKWALSMCNFNATLVGGRLSGLFDFPNIRSRASSDVSVTWFCDTTSFFYGILKKKTYKVYEQDVNLLEGIGEAELTDEKMKLAEAFICKLYNQVTEFCFLTATS